MADDVKQVKVDNWGIYFLQRLKHFFNRTDYCDLTLQFQDNAQLKVHRLVLSACTEYFELLERTCEMYEDCLVMPDDLQADIVVPIVNFMYTGQLEFKMDLLEKLHQCSEIMNMPVLTKLLDSHRPKPKITQSYNAVKRAPKRLEMIGKETIKSISATEVVTTSPVTYKRSHGKAFEKTTVYRDKKIYLPVNKPPLLSNGGRTYREPSPIPLDQRFNKKVILSDPRPTRYELPEELDSDNIFENSFCNISYTSQPLMVHPETRKQYSKRPRLAGEASSSKKLGPTTVDIVECKKPTNAHEDSLFEDSIPDETDMFTEQFNIKAEPTKDSNQLFDQILGKNETKVTIETKNNKLSANLDHAKIISEVLKKYPHLVKSNKNIKLKILNTPKNIKKQKLSPVQSFDKPLKTEKEPDYTFETDVLDSKQAARLIAMGADNIDGPWICLICGTPGKAMNFTSYYKFRRHLVEIHNEKPVLNICEYCGQKSTKRNYLMHHLYTKHGVVPPPQYHFPKCNHCNYIALTEALLAKHKASHVESKNFRCNVCPSSFHSSTQLLMHIQNTGHKYSADRKSNLQCIYCQKVFMREINLCAHLKTHHKKEAIKDGIIDDFDDDAHDDKKMIVKSEPNLNDFEDLDIQYQIQQRPDGNITVVTKKAPEPTTNPKQKILNAGLSTQVLTHKNKLAKTSSLNAQNDYIQEVQMSTPNDSNEEIVLIDNTEYIMRDSQLIPRKSKPASEEFILSDHGLQSVTPTTSTEFTNIHNVNVEGNIQQTNILLKNPENLTQPIPIYVSNEEEYKAIMASNQPIIFDGSDSNKTLTVLTTPHASALETTAIDLDTAQSNDMMIIQDEYPLNVSEAVVSENSNIVVVYSHQVGNQNKQYQLLTTQGLEAQFVQSSSIITQNYETVTTTAPVNAHVLEKQESWQNNLQQIVDTDQIEITPVPNLESIVEQTDQVQTVNTVESNNDINNLPQVQLSSNSTKISNSNLNVAPTSQCHKLDTKEVSADNLNESTDEDCIDNAEIISSIEVIEEGPIEETVDSTKATDNVIEAVTVSKEKITQKGDAIIEETENIESQTYTQQEHIESQTYTQQEHIESQTYTQQEPTESQIFEQTEPNTETVIENIVEVSEQHPSEEMNKETTAEVENVQLNNEEDSNVSINTEQMLTEDAATKVQTLTSEWSEEDMQERQEDNPAETTPDNSSAQINDRQECMKTNEVEESIENIKQEVARQFTVALSASEQGNEEEISAHVVNTSQEDSGQIQNQSSAVVSDPAVAQEKISSLLNDWDDNDSQEGNDSVTENVPSGPNEVVQSVSLEINDTIEKEHPDKHDKIKSLVSDWDEDEEEEKD